MRILVIEDNDRLADHVAGGLAAAGFAVDRSASVAEAGDALAVQRFDAVVLDLGLPDGDGNEVLRALRGRQDATPVLILTARDAVDSRVAGLDAGADDYLVKPFAMAELIARLKALLRRPGAALGLVIEVGNLTFDTVGRTATVAGAPLSLSRRELGLLEILLRRTGQVVTRDSIVDSLYRFDDEVTPNAVEAAVSRLRRALAGAGATPQVHTLRGVGYLLSEPAPESVA